MRQKAAEYYFYFYFPSFSWCPDVRAGRLTAERRDRMMDVGGGSMRTASLRFVIDLSLRRAKLWPFYFLRQTAEERIPAACWLNLEDTEVSDSLRWKIFHSKCKKNNNIADIFIFPPLILFQIYGGLQGLFNFFSCVFVWWKIIFF